MDANRILGKVSYHAVYDRSALDALRYAKAHGFAGIQLAVESPHLSLESLSEVETDEIARRCVSEGLYVNIHAPDEAASLYQTSTILRRAIMDYYRALFAHAARLGSKVVTIHFGGMPSFRSDTASPRGIPDEDLALYREAAAANLDALLKMVRGRFVLCVENYGFDAFAMSVLKPFLASGRLSLCWDIAKSWGKPEESFLLENIGKVRQVHLHDIRRGEDGKPHSHCVIGTGEIDFRRYLSALDEADVLDYCIEVRPREKAKESLEALKKLLAADC